MEKNQREEALEEFKANHVKYLVKTDIGHNQSDFDEVENPFKNC